MAEADPEIARATLAVVRGELAVAKEPGGFPIIQVTWQDLATGFLWHLHRPTLNDWACFVIMSDIEFPGERGRRSETEERFLENLHNAANDWPLDEDAESLGAALARSV
jgi:hypothetical protein